MNFLDALTFLYLHDNTMSHSTFTHADALSSIFSLPHVHLICLSPLDWFMEYVDKPLESIHIITECC